MKSYSLKLIVVAVIGAGFCFEAVDAFQINKIGTAIVAGFLACFCIGLLVTAAILACTEKNSTEK